MDIKKFLKPTIFKILLFMFIGIFYIYFARDEVCGAGLSFAFCYKAYGFPFSYAISGDIEPASGYIKTLFFGENFAKYGNLLINPITFIFDAILIYSLACFLSLLLKNMPKLK